MKKRFLAVFLALALCVGLAPTAFASGMERNGESTRIEDVKRKDADLSEIVFSKDPLGVAEVRYPCLVEDSNTLWESLRVVVVPDGTTISAPSCSKDEGVEGHIGTCVYYMTGPGIADAGGSMFQGLMGHEWYEDTGIAGMAESEDFVQFVSVRVTVEIPTESNGNNRYYDELSLISESGARFLAASGETFISPIIPMTIAKFTDLSPTGFYLDAVEWALSQGITTGKTATTFAPGLKCSHSEILTFLWRAAGEPDEGIKTPIANVKEDDFFYKAAQWANDMGMIDPGSFAPKASCTRADAVRYIWQAFGSPAAEYDGRFTDVAADAAYAQAVAWAVEKGVTTGATAAAFNPGKICSRGEIVTFLCRAYQ